MEREHKIQIWINAALLLFFGALFIIGTFTDEAVAGAIYSPGNTVVAVITALGLYPFTAAAMLFIGSLYERAVHCEKSKPVKVLLCGLCCLLALAGGITGGYSLLEKNSFGFLFPALNKNIPAILAVSVIFVCPMFVFGYRAAKNTRDKLLAKRVIGLIVILLISIIAMQVLKHSFTRPRFRTVAVGYEGIGFVPWYTPFPGSAELSELYGLNGDEFLSFPSGHSILSVCTMFILPCLSWLFPKLKDKQVTLFWAGLIFGVIIMFTRMVLGAHYLSDVSAGAIIGTVLSLVFTFIQIRISGSERQSLS